MSTLKEKAQQVLDEKENKIIPENIKNGVEIFDVTGSYKGGSGNIDLTDGRKFGYSTFSELPDDIANANWEDIDDASSMFNGCRNLQEVPQLDTSNVTNMEAMFSSCNNLRTISQLNTSKVTNMGGMFFACNRLQSIPMFDTSNVTFMDTMFDNCSTLQTVPQLNTGNVTSMGGMFNACTNLVSIPRLDMRKARSVTTMFYNCDSLQSLDLYYLNIDEIHNYSDMLTGVPTNCEIIVKTQAQKDWLLNNVRSDLTNIQVVGITHNVNIDNENIKPISSAYEDDVVKLEPIEVFRIVTSFKLNGVLVQGNSFVMPQEDVVITDVVIEAYYVIESNHPYKPNMSMVELYNGNISGASKLKVDVEYNLENGCDFVYINYHDETGSVQKVYDDGIDDIDYRYNNTFYTEDNYIQITMNTDGSVQRYGVKVTLTRLDEDGNPID